MATRAGETCSPDALQRRRKRGTLPDPLEGAAPAESLVFNRLEDAALHQRDTLEPLAVGERQFGDDAQGCGEHNPPERRASMERARFHVDCGGMGGVERARGERGATVERGLADVLEARRHSQLAKLVAPRERGVSDAPERCREVDRLQPVAAPEGA
eukprot:CAMPEP_0113275866 /NCGR_PEP_ID=MMETSP0008_2-20120614/25183_1 /TAXON_ID=97485 /ORGANISM="Prymnesium parvum" /LENGTH=156 /DNA_ID=CAMNT_0000125619 /DNA_START=128 /DNA_END=595 /DNA_ORIENTATION=- /assembly_acc=CAM_ASM_000153